MKLTKNFDLSEFSCKDGSDTPQTVIPNLREVANNLQHLRDYIDTPIYINSGYRTQSYNKKVGGVKSSQHLLGKAADIHTGIHTSKELYDIIEQLIKIGQMKQGGLGLYDTFVHYDCRGTKARWDFRTNN